MKDYVATQKPSGLAKDPLPEDIFQDRQIAKHYLYARIKMTSMLNRAIAPHFQ